MDTHFDGDAFISYAHLDDVELVEGRKGWVANLHRALEVRVGQLLGKPPHIWRDPKLSGNDLFADTLIDRLKRVAVLVTVVSPRYLKSEWTLRELDEFWRAAEEQGGIHVSNKARVFKVLKTPVPLDRTPPGLRALIGYEFFKVEPETGKVRELDEVFGPDAQRDFWLRLDDLAHDIVGLLEALERPAPSEGAVEESSGAAPAAPAPARAGQTVYLAETTSDLRDEREALKRDLRQQGYAVLPDRAMPYVADEAKAVIRDDLRRCRMSIHLVGRNYGVVPEGSTSSLIEIQHELATERAAEGGFSRLIWIPDGQHVDDERQQRAIAQLRLDPRIRDHADLLETFFEDLRTTMQDWLKKAEAPAERPAAPASTGAAAPPQIYLVADPRDAELIAPWADRLFEEGLEVVRPVFEGDEAEVREYHEENLATCDGVLVFYGAGNELWLRRKLRELQKAAGYGRTKPQPIVGICLVGARTPEKERFRTHEAFVVPQWEGCAIDPLRPFISQLKAGRSV